MFNKSAVLLLIVASLLPLQLQPLDSAAERDIISTGLGGLNIAVSTEALAAPAIEIKQEYSQIPVLMYHVLADYSGTYEQLYVGPEVFRQQLSYLREQGYHTVTMSQALQHWTKATPLPEKPIVLSFDDGYRSMYTQAFPILQEFGYKGTFYLHTAKIDTAGGLTRAMIKEMAAAGMEIGSHTVSHPDLTKINSAHLIEELRDSKQTLEGLTGSPVLTFAYPAGRNNQQVRAAVSKAGYLGAVTTQYGPASSSQSIFALKRIRINKSDGIAGFITKIEKAVPH